MKLPKSSIIAFTPDLRICRLLNGMWQVSGAHGSINPEAAIRLAMFDFIDAGFTTWDLADHYGPGEGSGVLLDKQFKLAVTNAEDFMAVGTVRFHRRISAATCC